MNQNLWLLPGKGNRIIRIRIGEGVTSEEFELPASFKTWDEKKTKTIDYIVNGNKIFSCPTISNEAIDIDCNVPTVKTASINYDGLERFHNLKKWWEHNKEKSYAYIYMEKNCSLKNFLDVVVLEKNTYVKERKERFTSMQENANGNCGEKIWQYVLSQLN